MERFRVMGSSEGAPLARVFGRNRVAGQMIWSSRFLESVHSERVGGKGGGGASVREYSYSVSFAIALCEGEVSRIGRIWADGQAVEQKGLTFRLHRGTEDQLPDPLIEALEGAAPAYRGTAYVVIENLDLTPYGNRIPQFNFEVFRRPPAGLPGVPRPPALDVRGVALVPGCGEYALATEEVHFRRGKGDNVVLNVHNDRGVPDLVASLDQLSAELPNARSVSLVVSWFGDDLRCDRCTLRPAVEQAGEDGTPMRWVVSGQGRGGAREVSRLAGRPIFGGTPADASVLQAIARMKADGLSVMFYPFILMDIQAGNGLADPWSGAADQPPVPWRGRITLAKAPGRAGSADKTAAAAEEVAAFFGRAAAGDFHGVGGDRRVRRAGGVVLSPVRAALCASLRAGGRGGRLLHRVGDARPDPDPRLGGRLSGGAGAVRRWRRRSGRSSGRARRSAMRRTGRSISGTSRATGRATSSTISIRSGRRRRSTSSASTTTCRCRTGATGRAMPTRRRGRSTTSPTSRATSPAARGTTGTMPTPRGAPAQERIPISDGAYGEDWVFRYKDLVSWWSEPHVNRLGGVKAAGPTAWQPRSKPIWFTELGCPAVNKGTNQPNVFHDPKSSESFFPYYSNGCRDDFIQHRYLQAMFAHWNDPANNPLFARLWRADGRHGAGRMSGPGTRGRGRTFRTGWRPGSTAGTTRPGTG